MIWTIIGKGRKIKQGFPCFLIWTKKNPTKPTLKLLTFPHMYLTFWPKHGTYLPTFRQFLGTSTSLTLAMPACRRQWSIAKKYSTQHLGTKPKFYHGRFQRTYGRGGSLCRLSCSGSSHSFFWWGVSKVQVFWSSNPENISGTEIKHENWKSIIYPEKWKPNISSNLVVSKINQWF